MTNELALMRRKFALTQEDVAALVGISQTSVGRIEGGDERTIDNLRLETALALQVVFGRRPERLLPDLFNRVEDAVMRQAAELDRSLDGQMDKAAEHKRALLADMMRRAGNRPATP